MTEDEQFKEAVLKLAKSPDLKEILETLQDLSALKQKKGEMEAAINELAENYMAYIQDTAQSINTLNELNKQIAAANKKTLSMNILYCLDTIICREVHKKKAGDPTEIEAVSIWTWEEINKIKGIMKPHYESLTNGRD